MNRALRNVGWRYLLRHPWQTGLMILGIALGVSVMVAIDLANSAASRAFDLSTDAIAGRATHQIIGGPAGLDEAVYARLRTEGVPVAAAPIVTDYVTSPQLGGRPIQLLGVDPFAEAPFRSYLVGPGSGGAASGERASGGAEPGTLRGLGSTHGFPDQARCITDFRRVGGRKRTGAGRSGHAGCRRPAVDRLCGRPFASRRCPQPPRVGWADPGRPRDGAGNHRANRAVGHHRSDRATRRPDRFRKPVRSAASRRPDRTGTPPFGRAGADDRRVPHEPDRAQPAGAGRRHVSDLQQHDFLGGAAPAAFRHVALPGGDARRDRRPGVGRGGDGRRARFAARPCVGRDPGPGRGAGGDADHQRPVLRRDSARDRDPRRQPGQGCAGGGVRNGGRGRAAGLGGDDRLAAPGAHPVRPGGDRAAAGAVDGACGRYRDCRWRRAVGSPHQESWRSALRASSP